MFTLSYTELLADSNAEATGIAPLRRKFLLTARIEPRLLKNPAAMHQAFQAFRHFTHPFRVGHFFDPAAIREELGPQFDFSVNVMPMTKRSKKRSLRPHLSDRVNGYCAHIIVVSQGDKDCGDDNIRPLLMALASAADRQAHDPSYGAAIHIDDTVPTLSMARGKIRSLRRPKP